MDQALTKTLWSGLRQLEELQELLGRMAARSGEPEPAPAALTTAIQQVRDLLRVGV
jgi:hypothetical protein